MRVHGHVHTCMHTCMHLQKEITWTCMCIYTQTDTYKLYIRKHTYRASLPHAHCSYTHTHAHYTDTVQHWLRLYNSNPGLLNPDSLEVAQRLAIGTLT